jgi:hypothetical protein
MRTPRTQESRILWRLHADWPNWTPAPELAKISLQYGRAIHSLRHGGWSIDNRVRNLNGVRCGEFCLGSAPVPSSKELRRIKSESGTVSAPAPEISESLFGDIAPDRSYQE